MSADGGGVLGQVKPVIVAAAGFGCAVRRLLPTALLVDPKPTDRRVDWPPPGREEEWRKTQDEFETAFGDNGQRAVFDCRYLAVTEAGRVTGLLQIPVDDGAIGVRSSFSGGSLAEGDTISLLANRALAFYKSLLPGLVAAVAGTDLACPRCGNNDPTKMILGLDREETGRLRVILTCTRCAKCWGDIYEED